MPFSPTNTSGDAQFAIIGKNTADNDVTTANVAANRDGSLVERNEFLISELVDKAQPVVFDWSDAPTVDEDGGRFAVSLAIIDRNTGAVAAGSIDITSITYSLEKSTSGGAFSVTGITQPSGATKSAGLVELEFDIAAAEWTVGDSYRLKVGGITATVGTQTYYSGTNAWVGQINEAGDLQTAVTTPSADSTANAYVRDVLGNKTDAGVQIAGTTASLMAYQKGNLQVVGANTDAATAPESANGTIFSKLRGIGEDTRYVADADPGAGTAGSLAARIGQASDAAVEPDGGAGSIHAKIAGIGDQIEVPTADSTTNVLMRDVLGNKSDAGSIASTASTHALVRALTDTYASVTGTADAGSTASALVDAALTQADADFWKGMFLTMTSGANDGLGRIIVDFDPATDTATVNPAFPQAIAAGDTYAIVSVYGLDNTQIAFNGTGVDVATNSLADQVYVGAGEQLRTFVAKTGGTAVAASKSLVNAIGNSGDTPLPAADNTTASTASSLQATIGVKADTSFSVGTASAATDTLMRRTRSLYDRSNPAAAADNTTAAGSASAYETLGRKDDTAMTGALTSTATMMRYVKAAYDNLINSGVQLDQTNTAASFTLVNNTNEQDLVEDTTFNGRVGSIYLDFDALAAASQTITVRLYRRIDGTNYRAVDKAVFDDANTEKGFIISGFSTRNGFKVTVQASQAEAANRSIPYEIFKETRI